MQKIIVKNFWIDPENPPINNFKEFSFGYSHRGNNFEYKIKFNPSLEGSEEALHKMFWIIKDSKKGSYLPWSAVPADIKSKLIIKNAKDPQESFLSELVDKVAFRLRALKALSNWI